MTGFGKTWLRFGSRRTERRDLCSEERRDNLDQPRWPTKDEFRTRIRRTEPEGRQREEADVTLSGELILSLGLLPVASNPVTV